MTMTRRQKHLIRALNHVQALKDKEPKAVQDIYGGLCHKLPVLLRTNGLCQVVAFIDDKAAGKQDSDRAQAYRLLKRHIAKTLDVSPDGLARRAGTAAVAQYIHDTRTLLEAWSYYKRFAVSILNVEQGVDEDGS